MQNMPENMWNSSKYALKHATYTITHAYAYATCRICTKAYMQQKIINHYSTTTIQ